MHLKINCTFIHICSTSGLHYLLLNKEIRRRKTLWTSWANKQKKGKVIFEATFELYFISNQFLPRLEMSSKHRRKGTYNTGPTKGISSMGGHLFFVWWIVYKKKQDIHTFSFEEVYAHHHSAWCFLPKS